MKRYFALLISVPLVIAAAPSNRQAVQDVLDKIIAGEALPPEIMNRQAGLPFPDLDQAIAKSRGCRIRAMDRLQNGNYGVQFGCKGRRQNDQPSAMIINVKDGRVSQITTSLVSRG